MSNIKFHVFFRNFSRDFSVVDPRLTRAYLKIVRRILEGTGHGHIRGAGKPTYQPESCMSNNTLPTTTNDQTSDLESILSSSTNPDLVLQYKADASRNGLLIMACAAPFWAIWMPWLLIMHLGAFFTLDPITWAMFAFFALVMAGAIGTVAVCLDNRLVIGAGGIKVPVRFWMQTLGRREFGWDELKELRFCRRGKPSDKDPTEIVFAFKRGYLPLRVEGFQHEDIPKILLALQAYAPTAPIVPDLQKLGYDAKPNTANVPLTFTRLWQEELNNRFGSTIFVPLEPGAKLQGGHITIVGQIAFGGLSAVYLAKQDNEKLVVIKEAVVPANADQTSKDKALEMFNREAKFLVTLDHPRIAHVLDHFMEAGRNYLTLEYIEGKDLRTYVKENGPVLEQVAVRWAVQIAELLAYLHELQPPIIHRDLTPDNLVLAKDGSISLIDFGAANAFMGTATGTLVGKQSYISPEQFRGKAVPESDLYSFGCTLHYLLTGKDPEPLDVSHPAAQRESVSPGMDELVAGLTQQEAVDRLKPAKLVMEKAKSLITIKRHTH
jgi:tRNA A-37 threonylcarbamoyl transferase component Bud32